MSCKLHFTGVNILIRRSSSGFILVIKVLSAKLISAAISAFDSLVYAPHLKKLPIDCQHTCALKRHQQKECSFL
jgi:hypothetical protein